MESKRRGERGRIGRTMALIFAAGFAALWFAAMVSGVNEVAHSAYASAVAFFALSRTYIGGGE